VVAKDSREKRVGESLSFGEIGLSCQGLNQDRQKTTFFFYTYFAPKKGLFMKENEMSKTVYYQDALNDEFSGIPPKNFYIPKDYVYIHKNIFYRFVTFIVYRLIMTPIAFFHNKFALHQKIVNRKALKISRKKGYFVYGNHTQQLGGAYTPNMVCFPKKVYVVVSPDNLAVKGLKTILEMSGAIPLPSTLEGMGKMMEAMEKRCVQGHVICIYPEAHIWPYCTEIRPFKSVSFKYPARFGAPVYAFTDTYKKRRFGSKPRIVTFVDGPFYADPKLSLNEQAQSLRDQVYNAMVSRAKKESTYTIINYVKREEEKAHD
jgi:1-acyl-sn-glycerol-3-phosphate acyltransferase